MTTDKVDVEVPAPGDRSVDRDRRGGRRDGRGWRHPRDDRPRRLPQRSPPLPRARLEPEAARRTANASARIAEPHRHRVVEPDGAPPAPSAPEPAACRRQLAAPAPSPVTRRRRRRRRRGHHRAAGPAGRGEERRRPARGARLRSRRHRHQGRRARRQRRRRHRDRQPRCGSRTASMRSRSRGPAAALVDYMERSRDIPTATSFRTVGVDVLDSRRRQLNSRPGRGWQCGQGVIHPPHRLRDRSCRGREPRDDDAFRAHRRRQAGPRARARRTSDWRSTASARTARARWWSRSFATPPSVSFNEFRDEYERLIERARTNTLTADELQGATLTLTNPGGHRDRGVGSAADARAGNDHRRRRDRLSGRVAQASPRRASATLGVGKVMTMTSTYDHRVIQGAESGEFLGRIESLLDGADALLRDRFRQPWPRSCRRSRPRRASAPQRRHPLLPPTAGWTAPTASSSPRCRRRHRSSKRTAPTVTLARTSIRSARRRSAIPAMDPATYGLTPGVDGADPRGPAARVRPRAQPRRGAPQSAQHLLQHHRLRDRAHLEPRAARLVARAHRVGQVPAEADRRGPAASARAAHQGRRHGALPARDVPRAENLLLEGLDALVPMLETLLTHGRGRRHRRGGHGHVAPRPARGRCARRQSLVRVDPQRVRARVGAARHRALRIDRRREVPRRRHRDVSHRDRQGDPGPPAAEPEPPRGDRPGGGGVVPRRADAASRHHAAPRSDGGAAGAHPRRRRVRRTGRRAGGAQPAVAARVHDRRHRALHRRQPGGLHHRPAARAGRPATRPTSPRASTSPSSTSTPTTSRRAWRRSRSRTTTGVRTGAT